MALAWRLKTLPPCLLLPPVQVSLTQSVTVRSLIVYGELLIQPPAPPTVSNNRPGVTLQAQTLVLNSSFILVRGKQAKFSISGADWDRRVTIYLRRCVCPHER